MKDHALIFFVRYSAMLSASTQYSSDDRQTNIYMEYWWKSVLSKHTLIDYYHTSCKTVLFTPLQLIQIEQKLK